ncbi:polysaccharide deacetylase family protein, partial [Streptomyces sp. G44]|uniref:polysaccharide deacetylase family protein n=1 Tax=Streptomyces sp. G44 TaxID=2807632 RepID=UPI001EF87FD8
SKSTTPDSTPTAKPKPSAAPTPRTSPSASAPPPPSPTPPSPPPHPPPAPPPRPPAPPPPPAGGAPPPAPARPAGGEGGAPRAPVPAAGSGPDDPPGPARRILDGGHDLGNHTQRHLDINDMSEADALAEITGCADRLRRLTGSIGTWFRPSRTRTATPLVERLASRAGYPHVLSYDVDSLDHTSPGAPAITRTIAAGVRAGSVVSLHFGYADTVAALPDVLQELERRGLHAVTTTELLT